MVVRADPSDKGRTHIQLPTPSGSDDQPVWQEQIDAAPVGAVLVAKPAEYRMSDILTMSTSRTKLDGYGSVIQANTSHNTHMVSIVDADDVTMCGFKLDWNRIVTTDQASTLDQAIVHINASTIGVNRFVLRDLTLVNSHQCGVYAVAADKTTIPLTGTIDNVTVDRVGFRGIRVLRGWDVKVTGCTVSNTGSTGIHQQQSNGGSVVRCRVKTCGLHGIVVNGSATVEATDVLVDGNHISYCEQSGIVAGANALRFQIVNNQSHYNIRHGISVDVQIASNDWTIIPVNAVVANNLCGVNVLDGVHARVLSDLVIAGNVLWDNAEFGITVQNAQYVTVSGNNVFGSLRGLTFSEGTTPNFVASGYHQIFGNNLHDNSLEDFDSSAAAALTHDVYLGDSTVVV